MNNKIKSKYPFDIAIESCRSHTLSKNKLSRGGLILDEDQKDPEAPISVLGLYFLLCVRAYPVSVITPRWSVTVTLSVTLFVTVSICHLLANSKKIQVLSICVS